MVNFKLPGKNMSSQVYSIIILCALAFSVVSSRKSRPTGFSIRLLGGSKPYEGFVNIYRNGRWKHISNSKWDIRNNIVVCKQLGYDDVYPDSKRIANYISDLKFSRRHYLCQGSEPSLAECEAKKINYRQIHLHCKAGKEVWVSCSGKREDSVLEPPISKSSGKVDNLPVRLRDMSSNQEEPTARGVLEIQYENEWYQVCADGWTGADSHVACGQLGYSYAAKHDDLYNVSYKQPSHHLMTKVNCTGSELTLLSCEHSGFKRHFGCKKSVLLSCATTFTGKKEKRVRLRGGQQIADGRVEVFRNGQWGTVCHKNWDLADANVVCKQLGFGTAIRAFKWAEYGQGSLQVLVSDVRCIGNESDFHSCKYQWPDESCKHYKDAGVKCNHPRSQMEKVRLIGGPSRTEGLVEVYHLGRWYAVCGVYFSPQDGEVVCRELGLGFGGRVYATWKYGIRRIGIYEPLCSGDESSLLKCSHRPWFEGSCRYYDMAAVKCRNMAPDILMDMNAMRSSIKIHSWHLKDLTCSMSENCLAATAYVRGAFHDPNANTRRLMVFTARILNKGTAAFRPNRHKDKWEWHSCHAHFHSMEYFARYDVIDFNGLKVAEGHKASFCLEDTGCDNGAMKMYNCTDKGDQGISAGCADNYSNKIDCQWVDVTDIKDGNYSLMVHLNPNKVVMESDYENNIATCEIHYFNGKVDVGRCSAEPCEQRSYGGTGYGMCCHFPFVYKGATYDKCITTDHDSPWCSTTFDFHQDNKWGYCKSR